jgi:hypothetical protein
MGGIWRLSQRNYIKLVEALKKGESYDLDKLGKLVLTDPISLQDLIDEVREEGQ